MISKVLLRNGDRSLETYAALDDGADQTGTTLITMSLMSLSTVEVMKRNVSPHSFIKTKLKTTKSQRLQQKLMKTPVEDWTLP